MTAINDRRSFVDSVDFHGRPQIILTWKPSKMANTRNPKDIRGMVSSSERVTAFDMVDVQLVDSKTNKKVMKNYLKLFFAYFIWFINPMILYLSIYLQIYIHVACCCCCCCCVFGVNRSTDDSIHVYTCMSHHVPQDPTTFSIDHLGLSSCDNVVVCLF